MLDKWLSKTKINKLESFISQEEINAVKIIEQLKKIIDERLPKYLQ